MNRLTTEQADLLRSYRKLAGTTSRALHEMFDGIERSCPHADDFHDDCPVCTLARMLKDTNEQMVEVLVDLDKFLLDGPEPAGTGG